MTAEVEARLAELGIVLPGLPAAGGNYVLPDFQGSYVGDVKADRYLVVVRGDASSVARARAMLESAAPIRVNAWPPSNASEKAEALGLRDGLAS